MEASWLVVVRGPAQVALAPLAWMLAAVDAAVRRPSFVVAGTVLLVCLPSQIQDVTGSGHITAADLAAGVAVAVVAVRLFLGESVLGDRVLGGRVLGGRVLGGRVLGERAATWYGWLPFAAAVASFALATVTATDVSESVRGFVRYTELFVLIPVAVAMAIRDRRDVLLVAGAVVATTVFEGAVGVWQYLTRTGASYAGEYVRAVGTFGAEQVVALGALIGYGIVVTLALGLALEGRARILILATAALLTVPLGLSLSRGAWIATACAVLLMVFVLSWRLGAAVAATALFVVAVTALGGSGTSASTSTSTLGERVTSIVSSGSEPDRSVKDRYALWGTAVGIWADHPVAGVGLKDFAEFRDSYAPMALSAGSDVDDPTSGFRREPLLSAHNQYLMVLSEQGTVGVLAFGGLLATLTVGALRRRSGDSPPTLESRFFDLAAPGIMIWTLIDFGYGDIGAGPTGVVLGVLLGLVARRRVLVPS